MIEEVKHNPLSGLTVGRIVHYVLESGRSKGEHRPAIVVRDWKQENGLVQLQVFTDGLNDGFEERVKVDSMDSEVHWGSMSSNTIWRTSVHYDENKEPGTWHWPERA